MPSLTKPTNPTQLTLPPRQATLAADADVLVVGGGPSGIGAAIGAARAGARVILVERYGFLGGNATAALVMPLMSFHTRRDVYREQGVTTLLPNDHGPGDPIIAGVLKELLEKLVAAGGAVSPSLDTGFVVPFDPEIFKSVALEMLDEAGVDYLFHALAGETIGPEKRPEGIVFETKSGPIAVRAKVIVDATGDGDVAARSGAGYEIGRDEDGLVQPITLMFRMVDFESGKFKNYVHENPDQWRGVHGLWDLVRKATEAGELDLSREDILFFATPHGREVSVNSTRVTKVLGSDVWDLSYAEAESRRQMRQIVGFFRKHVPGFEEAYAAQSGVQVGVRETRRVIGEYRLEADDLIEARRFEDVIARGSYPLDIHNPTGKGTVLRNIKDGDAYDIPLRSLIPQGVNNLLVAGRAISGSHEAHSSYRVMPICMATGQAAGVAAAAAAKTGRTPIDVPATDVQMELLRQGAELGTLAVE